VKRIAMTATVRDQVGVTYLQAEDAQLSGGAAAVKPDSTWTGESQFAGSGYASLPKGSTATFDLGTHPAALVIPVFDLQPGDSAVTSFAADGLPVGSVDSGAIGAQGDSPAPGAILPRTLGATVLAGATTLTATTAADGDDAARLDAVMVQPLVSRLVLGGDGHGTALLRSAGRSTIHTTVAVPGTGTADVWSYDGTGRLLQHSTSSASGVPVTIGPGGVTIVRR
jgi:hypothetical protein